jgi:hypothetical protein
MSEWGLHTIVVEEMTEKDVRVDRDHERDNRSCSAM